MRRLGLVLLYILVIVVWLAFLLWASPCPSGAAGIGGMCLEGLVA